MQTQTIENLASIFGASEFFVPMIQMAHLVNFNFSEKLKYIAPSPSLGGLYQLIIGSNSPYIHFAQIIPRPTLFSNEMKKKLLEEKKLAVNVPASLMNAVEKLCSATSYSAEFSNKLLRYEYVNPMLLINIRAHLGRIYLAQPDEDPNDIKVKINSLYLLVGLYPILLVQEHNNLFNNENHKLDPQTMAGLKALVVNLGGPGMFRGEVIRLLHDSGIAPAEIKKFAKDLEKYVFSQFDMDLENEDPREKTWGSYHKVVAAQGADISAGIPNTNRDKRDQMFDIYLESFNPPLDKIPPATANEILAFVTANEISLSDHSWTVLRAIGDPFESINPAVIDKAKNAIKSKLNPVLDSLKGSSDSEYAELDKRAMLLARLYDLLNDYKIIPFMEYRAMFDTNFVATRAETHAMISMNDFIKMHGLDTVMEELELLLKDSNLSDGEKEQFGRILKRTLETHFKDNPNIPDEGNFAPYGALDDVANYVNTYLLGFHLRGEKIHYEEAKEVLKYIYENNLRVNALSKKILMNVEDPIEQSALRVVSKRIPMTPAHNYELFRQQVDKLLPSDVGVVSVTSANWNQCQIALSSAITSANTLNYKVDFDASFEIDHDRTTATQIVVNELYQGQNRNEVKVQLVKGEIPEDKPKNWSTQNQPKDSIVAELPHNWFDINRKPPIEEDHLEIVKGVLRAMAAGSQDNTVTISNLYGHRTMAVELAKIAVKLGYKPQFNQEDGTDFTVNGITRRFRSETGDLKRPRLF